MALFGKKQEAELDKPIGATVDPFAGTSIHVIPEQFYGAATRPDVRVTTPVEGQAPAAAPVIPAEPVVPVPEVPAEVAGEPLKEEMKPRRRRWPWLVLVVLLLGGSAAVAWWYFIGSVPTPAPTPVVVGPQCGNGLCETGETVDLCNLDCKPVVVCGDNKCEATETAQSCVADCGPAPVVTPPLPLPPEPGADADNDGLTDVEERTVFGSDPNNVNTDRDNFVDLNEVLNLYDPAVVTPATLDKNSGITTITAEKFTLLMPKAWLASTGEDGAQTFAAPGNEQIIVRVITKATEQTFKDWYIENYSPANPAAVEILKNRRGLEYVVADDRLRAWVDLGGGTVVGVRYDLVGATTIEYKNVFAMVVQSVGKKL